MNDKITKSRTFKDSRLKKISIKVSEMDVLVDRQVYYSIFESIEDLPNENSEAPPLVS